MGKKVTVETNSQVFKIYIGPNTGGDSSADISGVFTTGHTFDFGNGITTTDFVYKFYAFQWGDYYYTPGNTGWQHVKVVNESYVNYNGYTVTYNPPKRTLELSVSPAGSGSVSGAGEYDAGSTVRISASAASGYKFSKWSDGDTNSVRDIVLNNDRSLTAYFEKITYYTITYTKYDDNTGNPPGAQTFQPNVTEVTIQGQNTLAKPSTSINLSYTITFNPNGGSTKKTSETNTRKRTTSYKFTGWTATKNGTEVQYTAGKSYKFGQGNKTLYPVWAVSGTSDAANTGVKVPTTAQCTRPGYKLLGFKVANSSEIVDYAPGASTGADFKSDTTLYAVWERIYYNVTLSANPSDGGTVSGAGKYAEGTEVTISASANPGYVFSRWSNGVTSSSMTIALYSNMGLIAYFDAIEYTCTYYKGSSTGGTVPAPQKYHAWDSVTIRDKGALTHNDVISSSSYTISFNANGGSTTKTSESCSITKTTKYSFKGWDTSSSASTDWYKAGQNVQFGAMSVGLYAVWAESSSSLSGNTGVKVPTAKECTRPGYKLLGFRVANSETVDYAPGASTTDDFYSDATLYAVWDGPYYTLTYTKYDDNIGEPPSSQEFKPNVTNVTISGKNTLAKAGTETNQSYKVTFNPNGGSTVNTSSTGSFKQKTTYEFKGWTATKNGTEVQYTVNEKYKFTQGDKKLYPVWAGSATQSDNTGVTLPTAKECTRSNYKLLGFSTSANATTATYKPGGSTGSNITSDTTLYAIWDGPYYTLTYTKYSDNTGNPPSAQEFKPNVTNVTISGKNTLAKSNTESELQYTITFNPNGGSTTNSSGTCAIKQTTSYQFKGWTTTKNGTEVQYTAGSIYTFTQGNKTFYPVWIGTTTSSANTGVTLPTEDECTRPGYRLLGFSSSANATTADYKPGGSTGSAYYSNTTLYAVWERIKYKVYFRKDTKENYDSVIVTHPDVYAIIASGEKFTLPSNGHVTKEPETVSSSRIEFKPANGDDSIYKDYSSIKSYTQNGWAYYNTSTTVAAGASVIIEKDTDFMAWWSSRTWNTSIKTPAAPTRVGYTFKGWKLDGTSHIYGAETNYTPGDVAGVTENTSFTAQWEINIYTVTLSVNPEGAGSVSGAGKYDAGSTVRISASAASGYKFSKWSDDDTNSIRDIVLNNDISLTAYFEKIYYVYFHKDNTEEYPSYITVAPDAHTWVYSGGSFTLPGNIVSKAQIDNGPYTVIFVPANGSSNITSSYYNRTKYTQNGWAYYNTTTWLSASDTINDIRSNLTFQAYWKTENWNDTITTPSTAPTKEGYTFKGWLADDGVTYGSGARYTPTGTGQKQLTAQWEVNEYTYNIVYKSSSGVELGTSTITGKFGSSTQVFPKSFTGYTPPGPQTVTFDSTTAKTITFVYTLIKYSITWNLNGGTWVTEHIDEYDVTSNITKFPTPEKTGYKFLGWYENEDFSGSAVNSISPGTVGDKVYYAKWEAKEYTYNIVYKSSTPKVELGTSTIKGLYGSSTQVFPAAFTGYTSPGPQTVTFDSTTAKTITFVYTPIEYTITWVLNGGSWGSISPREKYTIESERYVFETPSRENYTFDGWYDNPSFTGLSTAALNKGVTGDRTYYAKWLAIFTLRAIRDNVCNTSVKYGSDTSSSGGDVSYAELSIPAGSSPTFTIRAFGGMGGAYDFDRWEYESSFSHVTFGNKTSKETTAQISSAINGRFLAYVYAYTKKVAYFKIKLGEHVKSCKISYTSYWENTQKEVTQTAKEITYYAVEGTPFSIDKSSIVTDYGYVATSGFGGNPGYTDDTLSNVKTITVSKAARYSLSALTNANGTFKGDVMITNDDGATARTNGTIETITLAEQISSKFKIQALPNNPSYYFSHWTRAAGTDFTYIDSTKNTDRDARIQFTGTKAETVYGLAMQANFNKWPSVRIGCRVSDSLSNPVLNGQYGVGDIRINYTNGPSYASNGEYIGNSKYEIKGYDIAGRGWVSRPGEYLSLEAIPAENYEFSKWILFGSSEDTYVTQNLSFQVPFVNCVLYAIFKPIKRDITISSNSSIVYNDPGRFYICKGTYDSSYTSYDTSIKILNNVDTFTMVAPIDPAVGYEFDGWYTKTNNKLTHHTSSVGGKNYAYVILTPGSDYYSSSSFVAKYSLKEFTLSTHTRAEILGTTATGTISPSYPDGTTVEYGQKIIFNAKPALEPRSKFSRWMLQRPFGDELELGTDSSLSYVHNYLCDTMLTAVFDLANILTARIHVNRVGYGTIDIIHKSGSEAYTYKDQTDKTFQCFETDVIVLTAKPQQGYKFLYWRYNDVTGRLKETYDSTLNLSLIDRNSTLTCIAFFEEINYSFYFKQQGGDNKCITAITIGSNMYTPQENPIKFTASSIEGKKVRLVSQVNEGSEYIFKEWRITNSDGKTITITSSTYDIENLLAYGETFTILAVYWRASQGNLTVRVVSGSKMTSSVSDGPGNYPNEYTTAQQWYDTGDNHLYYLSQSELSNPAIFGECTWYVNGRTAQMRGGAEGSWAPKGTQSWPNANDWITSCEGNWFVSDTPQVGSVAVFKKYMSSYGHVGVVEAVNSDGTLTISQFNGIDPAHYHTALAPLTRAIPSNFIFINNTVNKVIGESAPESTDSSDTLDETTTSGSAINIGGESWIEYNAQQYKIVTTYFTGETCTLVAIANSGFAFDYWQDPHGNIIYGEENSTYSFTVTEDTAGTYLAYFRRTEVGPEGEEPEEPYDPEDPSIKYKYYAYSAVQSYIQQRGQAYWNYKKNKWLVGYGPFLTSKFIELEYIESSKVSQQWMSLGWKPSPLTILEFTGQFTDISGDQVIGSRYCGVHVQDGSMWFECGSTTQPIEFDTKIHTFKINCGTGECYLDNVLYSCAKLDRVAKSPIKLFGLDNEDFAGNKVALDPYSSSFRLYSAKIWDINPNSPNMLVRDLVPVRRWHREEDQALYVGLWDRVFNRFYQSNAYMTIDGEYTQIKLIPGPDIIENNEPKVLEKTYR